MRPAAKTTGNVDVPGMAKIDEAAPPAGRKMTQAVERHTGVVQAADDEARKRQGQVGHRPEVDGARMKPIGRTEIARRDEQGAAHLPGERAPHEIGDQKAAEAVGHEVDCSMPEDLVFEPVAPEIEPRAIPIVLFDKNRLRIVIEPMALPVAAARSEQPGNDERCCHDISRLRECFKVTAAHSAAPDSWLDYGRVGHSA